MDHRIELVEAARRLKLGYYVVHRWALTGELKADRVNGRWFADAADVERLVRERAKAAQKNASAVPAA